jgi:hypothetical protein
MPAAVRRPPPVGKPRQNTSADTGDPVGTRTETRYPPLAFGETMATALPVCAFARSLASVPLARRAHAASGSMNRIAPRAPRRARGLEAPRQLHVLAKPVRQAAKAGRAGRELERIGVTQHLFCERGGSDVEVGDGLAVGVVVHGDTQRRQAVGVRGRETGGARASPPLVDEAVTERPHGGPAREASLEISVDEEARADVGARIDVRLEPRVRGHLAGEVMVEVTHERAGFEQREQPGAVRVERDVEHRALVARRRPHAFEQRDVALDPGDQRDVGIDGGWPREAQLLQRTQAVGVTIEGVDAGHGSKIPRPRR